MKDPGNDVGKLGEDFVQELCETPFGADFIFRGPKYKTPSGPVELADLFLLIENSAVLFEIKTADRNSKTDWNEERWAKWAKQYIDEKVQQLLRGCEALVSGKVKSVTNNRQGQVIIDSGVLADIYAVCVIDHPVLDKWGALPDIEVHGRKIPLMSITHEEVTNFIAELSTSADFLHYLKARSKFLSFNTLLGCTESDVLAAYKTRPELFEDAATANQRIVIESGLWDGFAKRPERLARLEADKNSFIVDNIISLLHTSNKASLPHIVERHNKLGSTKRDRSHYIAIANELAKLRRIDRRGIGNNIVRKSEQYLKGTAVGYFGCICKQSSDCGFVFYISNDERDRRTDACATLAMAYKLKNRLHRVVAIAFEPHNSTKGYSVDAVLMSGDVANDEQRIPIEQRKNLLQLFPTKTRLFDDYEFPQADGAGSPTSGTT